MELPTDPLTALATAQLEATGRINAAETLLVALMEAHPNRELLADTLQQKLLLAGRHWDQFPDQAAARFRAESLLEDWISRLRIPMP